MGRGPSRASAAARSPPNSGGCSTGWAPGSTSGRCRSRTPRRRSTRSPEPFSRPAVEVFPMDFERVQAEWTLGRYPLKNLPEVAAQAMMAGFEGPFILDLVGYAAPSLDRLKPETVEGAFREMGLPTLTKSQALLLLARRVASRVLRKEVSCRAGAEAIQDLALSI